MYEKRLLLALALSAAYVQARSEILQAAERSATRIGPRWLGRLAHACLYAWSRLMGVHIASEGGEGLGTYDAAKQYMVVWHPHGFIAWSALFIVSKFAVEGHPYGKESFAMVAPALFRLPIFSEALMLVNGRRVDKDVVEHHLDTGRNICIQPGGVKEQMISRHDQEQAVFPANLGFIRMAIKHGSDLIPLYLFNENQLYEKVDGFEGVTDFLYRWTGLVTPAMKAKFGIPVNVLMPKAADIHVRWGPAIHVGAPDSNPTEEQVEGLFQVYLTALRKLFNQHAAECLPPEVAAKGLKIIRLDGKPVPEESPVSASHSRL